MIETLRWDSIKTSYLYIVPRSVLGVSSHLFLRALGVAWAPGVSRPGVTAPGVACPGVESHIRVLTPGVAPGVSAPLALPGVSSQRLMVGVETSSQLDFFVAPSPAAGVGVSPAVWSQRPLFLVGAPPSPAPEPFITRSVPSFALSCICCSSALWWPTQSTHDVNTTYHFNSTTYLN